MNPLKDTAMLRYCKAKRLRLGHFSCSRSVLVLQVAASRATQRLGGACAANACCNVIILVWTVKKQKTTIELDKESLKTFNRLEKAAKIQLDLNLAITRPMGSVYSRHTSRTWRSEKAWNLDMASVAKNFLDYGC
eukprot:5188347-Amphidinium_carterae.2